MRWGSQPRLKGWGEKIGSPWGEWEGERERELGQEKRAQLIGVGKSFQPGGALAKTAVRPERGRFPGDRMLERSGKGCWRTRGRQTEPGSGEGGMEGMT